MQRKRKRSWFSADYLIGNPQIFSLEERIFNTFCVTAAICLFLEIFFNYYVGLKVVALICFLGTLFALGLYYLSRNKRKTKVAIYSLSLVANITFLFNYFFNSGINGPNLLLFGLILLITAVVVPKKQLIGWVVFNIVIVFVLLVVEYHNPNLMPYAYVNDWVRFVDFGVTYFVAALLICLTIKFVRNNYDEEKNAVSQKSKEIEERNAKIIEQNQSLAKLNSEKAKLFSIVAHDIRSPLSSILGYLELLADTDMTEAENNNVKQRLLQVTRDTSEMLFNVLAWSKSQMEGTRVELTAININAELEEGLNLERSIAHRKNIALQVSGMPNIVVAADLNMFRLVLRNLVNNAIKFTPEGGKVHILVEQDKENGLVKVIDNGVGIDEEEQENLFKLRASSTFGTNNEKGVGLGLLLCREFTELQEGKIWYENNQQVKGSTFVVSFKLYRGGKGIEI